MLTNSALMDGNVLTMNSSQPSAEAVAVTKDRIFKVGTNGEISRWIGENTKVNILKERTVVLCFINTYLRVVTFRCFLGWIDLKCIKSSEEIQNFFSENDRLRSMLYRI
jgi:predicted amidohydrolase YtcJ